MGISRPTSDPTFATDANYSAGSNPWNGQPPRVDPGAARTQGHIPGTARAAEIDNYVFGAHGDWLKWLALRIGMGFYGDGGVAFQTIVMDGTTAVPGCTLSTFLGVPTYFATRDMFFGNLTVNSGVAFVPSNYRVVVFDTLLNNGHINCDGQSATGSSGQSTWSPGTLLGGTASGAGGASSGAAGGGAGVSQPTTSTAAGGRGGVGGASIYGAGGTGSGTGGSSGVVYSATLSQGRDIMAAFQGCVFAYDATSGLMLAHPLAGGSGAGGGAYGDDGGGTNTSAGGGGGAGAGSLVLFAQTLINNGSITCNGGNGAAPVTILGTGANGQAGAGGGGGGGNLTVCTGAYSGSGAMTANGGSPGSGGGTVPVAIAGAAGRVAFYNLGA